MTTTRRFTILVALLISWGASVVSAQIPPGYYDDADDSSPAALRSSLHTIVKTGAIVRSYANVIPILQDANEDPNNSNNLIRIYSGTSYPKVWASGAPGTWDREHVFPQSRFGSTSPYQTDVHALMPTIPLINNRRGNNPFGVVPIGGNPDEYGNKLGTGLGGFTVFEPRDGAKGDIARALFYMDIRYEGTGGELNLFLSDANSQFAEMGRLSELIEWHWNDPPDDWERRRNDRLYVYQNNRNPFIDHPQLVNCIYNNTCTGDFLIPAVPRNLVAVGGLGFVDLDWDANTENDLEGYRIYRETTSDGAFDEFLFEVVAPANFLRDETVTGAQPYYYHVTAYDTAGNESGLSNQAIATPIVDETPPATPTGFDVFAGSGFLYVQWSANTETDLAGYRLYRGTSSPPTNLYQTLPPAAVGFLDDQVEVGTRYYYTVSAFDTSGNESNASPVLSAVAGEAGSGCGTDLIISEYVVGSVGFNRALELYNPTGAALNLSAYSIEMYSGGTGTPAVQLSLEGRGAIGPQGTFVIVHQSAADANLRARADMIDEGNSLWFNGDDPIVLRKSGVAVDSIGEVGSADIYGRNVTLRRKPDVFFGRTTIDAPFSAGDEWLTFAVNTWSGLGEHVFDCEVVAGTTAVITHVDPSVTGRDALRFQVTFSNPVAGLFDLDSVTVDGTLESEATLLLAGADPIYTVYAILDDPDANGSLGITVGGGDLDELEGGFESVSSALYTVTNQSSGDINGDGVVNVADVTALARWVVEGLPPGGPSPP